MNVLLAGVVAGCAATAPMTAAMKAMHLALPPAERSPLPPRQIVENATAEVGIQRDLDESQRRKLAMLSHFAYGAAMGAVYAPLARQVAFAPPITGAAFGLAVWAGSYLGWLPASGLLHPATEHPARRNWLMIAAHVVWGVAAGALLDRMTKHGHPDEQRRAE